MDDSRSASPIAPSDDDDASARTDGTPADDTDTAGLTELGLLCMAIIWAVNFSVIKVGLAELRPFAFNALRFPFAALLLFLVLRSRGRIPLPRREDVGRIVLLGVLGNIVYQYFFILGMDRTRAGNASLLLASTPIFTALWSVLAGHEKSQARLWAGAAATLLGMMLVIGGGEAGFSLGGETVTGDLLMAGSSVVWSIYTVAAREPIRRYGSIAVTAWTLWVGTAGLIIVGLPSLGDVSWDAVSPGAWGSVLYAGLFGIGVAYLLWYHGVNRIGSTRTAVWANVVPVFALIVAWLWLGEVPTVWQIAGAAVIIAGLQLARGRRRRGPPRGARHDRPRGRTGERLLRR